LGASPQRLDQAGSNLISTSKFNASYQNITTSNEFSEKTLKPSYKNLNRMSPREENLATNNSNLFSEKISLGYKLDHKENTLNNSNAESFYGSPYRENKSKANEYRINSSLKRKIALNSKFEEDLNKAKRQTDDAISNFLRVTRIIINGLSKK
jgi:hypothetical protein